MFASPPPRLPPSSLHHTTVAQYTATARIKVNACSVSNFGTQQLNLAAFFACKIAKFQSVAILSCAKSQRLKRERQRAVELKNSFRENAQQFHVISFAQSRSDANFYHRLELAIHAENAVA